MTGTTALYEQVARRLAAWCGRTDITGDDGLAACDVLGQRLAEERICWSTAKQYASAVRWALRRDGRTADVFDEGWDAVRARGLRPRSRRRPARRSRIEPSVVEAIEAMAEAADRPLARTASALFTAGLILGLRPCEWAGARWADRARTRLVIRNAKATRRVMEHGPFVGRLWVRANGTERVLCLTAEGRAAGVREVVDRAIEAETARPWGRGRSSIWRAFKGLVRDACARGLVPARHRDLTLYAARHQFAADMKRWRSVSDGEVAAAMGHVAVRTAVSGYGRRMAGGLRPPLVAADARSVAAVRSRALPRAPQARPAVAVAAPTGGARPSGP